MWKWRLTWKQLWLSSINIICCSFRGSMTQKPLLFSFLKVQSKYTVHKVIISKYFIWSWYSIHFVSLHHSYHHHHLPIIMQQSIESFNLPPLPFHLGNPQEFDQFSIFIQAKQGEGGGIEPYLTTLGNLNQKCQDFNIQDKRGFSSAPHRNITFELQISHN